MATLSLERIHERILLDPSIYPQTLDFAREAILFLRLTQEDYRAASFLDDRILTPQSEGRWLRFAEVAQLLEGLAPASSLHFIFHAGHVGSTLLSRLLDEADGVLGLREPLALRILATAFDAADAPHALAGRRQLDTLLDWHLRLWRRGYADTKAVVAKVTSSAARLHPILLGALPDARALYLNLRLEPYLATLLAGDNSYLDLRGHAAERFTRLSSLGAPPLNPLHTMSLGEIAAMTWAAETLTQREAERSFGQRVLSLDFDALLGAPSDTLRRACAHLALRAPEPFFANLADNPVLRRYAKAPEHPYTPQLRSEILAASRARNGDEIRKGLLWIERLAQQHEAGAAILSA